MLYNMLIMMVKRGIVVTIYTVALRHATIHQ